MKKPAADQTTDATFEDAPKKRGFLMRTAMTIGRVSLTLVFLGAAGFAVQSGSEALAQRAEAVESPDAAEVLPVSSRSVDILDSYTVTRSFLGQIEAAKTVNVSFELAGQLENLGFDEGDRVEKGQVLATLDTSLLDAEVRRLEASRDATQAQLKFANQTIDRVASLTRAGHTSQATLDEALARVDELAARIAEIEAGLFSVDIQLAKSQVTAPFAGRVTARLVDGGETLGAGQTILSLVQLDAPRLRVGVPLDLAPVDLATAEVTVGGVQMTATLITIRPDIDPVTRTRTALFEMPTDAEIAFGQTARLLSQDEVPARGFWVDVTALKEGQRGQWTVLAVDPADPRVQSLAVHVLHTDGARAFVTGGFPEGLRLIDAGPQRITVGQSVQLALAD